MVRTSSLTLIVLLALVGCADHGPRATRQAVKEEAPASAEQILQRMIAAYRSASCYRDRGVLHLRYVTGGAVMDDRTPLSVQWAAPDRLRLRAYFAEVVCDGQRMVAHIRDPATEDLDHQVLVRPQNGPLTLEELYRDMVLRESITGGAGRQPAQLELLLAPRPLEPLFVPSVTKRLLPPASFDGSQCYRVEAMTQEGAFVFWVDQSNYVLRKLEYPVASLVNQMPELAGATEAVLAAEFVAAELQPPHPSVFQCQLAPDAKLVSTFVLPPPPLPSELMGRHVGEFHFESPTGDIWGSRQTDGSITVLLWFQNHPACRQSLESAARVAEQFAERSKDKPGIVFGAVSVDPSSEPHEIIADRLAEWAVDLPWFRDSAACGRDVFAIPWAPAIIVLGPDRKVHFFQVGANPDLEQDLSEALNKLIDGEDVASAVAAEHAQQQAAYERMLASVQHQASPSEGTPSNRIVPPRPPSTLVLKRQWKATVADPGNLLSLPPEDEDVGWLVLSSRRHVVELSGDGRVTATVPLEGLRHPIDYLRADFDNPSSILYAGAAMDGPVVHVFDQHGKLRFAYPAEDQHRETVADVQFVGAPGSGSRELAIAYSGLNGLHFVSLDGQLQQVDTSTPYLLSLAGRPIPDSPTAPVVATSQRGILRVFKSGRSNPPEGATTKRPIFYLFAAPWSDDTAPYCGMTFDEQGRPIALGLDVQFREQWEYALPAGTFADPVQFATSCAGPDHRAGWWILAGCDGTLHFVSADGKVRDHMAAGEAIRGMAVRRVADEWHMAFSTAEGVTCYRWQ